MIKQIIPCNVEMYAVLTHEDGSEERRPIIMFELWSEYPDDGEDEIWPLAFDPSTGVDSAAPHLFESNFDRYVIEGR